MIPDIEKAEELRGALHLTKVVKFSKDITRIRGCGASMTEDAGSAARRILRKVAKELFPSADVNLYPRNIVVRVIPRHHEYFNAAYSYDAAANRAFRNIPPVDMPDGTQIPFYDLFCQLGNLLHNPFFTYTPKMTDTGVTGEIIIACALPTLRNKKYDISGHIIRCATTLQKLKTALETLLAIYPTYQDAVQHGDFLFAEAERLRNQADITEAQDILRAMLAGLGRLPQQRNSVVGEESATDAEDVERPAGMTIVEDVESPVAVTIDTVSPFDVAIAEDVERLGRTIVGERPALVFIDEISPYAADAEETATTAETAEIMEHEEIPELRSEQGLTNFLNETIMANLLVTNPVAFSPQHIGQWTAPLPLAHESSWDNRWIIQDRPAESEPGGRERELNARGERLVRSALSRVTGGIVYDDAPSSDPEINIQESPRHTIGVDWGSSPISLVMNDGITIRTIPDVPRIVHEDADSWRVEDSDVEEARDDYRRLEDRLIVGYTRPAVSMVNAYITPMSMSEFYNMGQDGAESRRSQTTEQSEPRLRARLVIPEPDFIPEPAEHFDHDEQLTEHETVIDQERVNQVLRSRGYNV